MTDEAKPQEMVIVEVRFLTPMPVQAGRVVGPGQRPGMQMAFPRIVVGQPTIHPLTDQKTTVVCILPVPQGVMVHYAEGGPCVITNQPMQILFGPPTDEAGEPKWAGEKVLVQ